MYGCCKPAKHKGSSNASFMIPVSCTYHERTPARMHGHRTFGEAMNLRSRFRIPVAQRKISPKFFRPKFFRGRPRGMSMPKCLFFQDLEGLTEVFGRMSAGISGQKLPLWAESSFLTCSADARVSLRCSRGTCRQWDH